MKYIITLTCLAFFSNAVFAQVTDSILARGPESHDSARSYSNPDSIYTIVEIVAEYPGGIMAWNRYLNNNFIYPNKAKKAHLQGDVSVRFIVERNGNTNSLEIVSCPEDLREVTLNLIKQSGVWSPAIQKGRKVRSYKTVTFYYKL